MSRFSQIMAAKGTKKFFFSNSVVQSSRSGSKQNTKRKPKVTYLTWVMVFLAAENENQQMEGLPPAVFMKIFLFSVRKKSITESIVKRKLRPFSVYVMVERIFLLDPYRRRTLRLFFRGLWNLQFHSIKEVDFSFQ